MTNHGRHNLSVAHSSWDTWLDGYVAGVPWRKVSIYNEGFLIAMMCDLILLHRSGGVTSLDVAMKLFYERFGKQKKGYTQADYLALLNELTNYDFSKMFHSYVNGTDEYLPMIREVLSSVGVELQEAPSSKWSETHLGVSLDESNQKITVSAVVPNSPADVSGLWYSDEIVAVNGIAPYKNVQQLMRMYALDLELTVLRKGKRVTVRATPNGSTWVTKYRCVRTTETTDIQDALLKCWKEGMS
jgi:predicted metalloprotease with PDZ domain